MMSGPEPTTTVDTTAEYTTPANMGPSKPDGFSKGEEVPPPKCFKCGAIVRDDAVKLEDQNIYCMKCVKFLANLGLETEEEIKLKNQCDGTKDECSKK